MQINYFKKSFVDSIDFVAENLHAFFTFLLASFFISIFLVPALFLGPDFMESLGNVLGLLVMFIATIISAWITVAIWIYVCSDKEKEEKNIWTIFSDSLLDTPSYIIFSIVYSAILLVSMLFFVLPIFIVGPMFFFLPYVAFMDFKKEGEGHFQATRRLCKGHFGSCFFFFMFFLIQQAYIFSLQEIGAGDRPLIIAQLGLIAGIGVSTFIEVWSAFFLKSRQMHSSGDFEVIQTLES